MRRYTSSQLRERFADALDAAERGEEVIVERRGVRFRLRAEPSKPRARQRKSLIEFIDPAVASGQWTWTWGNGGLRFARRGRRR